MAISRSRAGLAGLATLLTLVANGQSTRNDPISISSVRPLAEAADILTSRYGIPISYEDVSYFYAGDLEDPVEYRKSYPNAASLLPKKRTLNFLPEPSENRAFDPAPADKDLVTRLLQYVIDQHTANGNAGRFKIVQTPIGLAIVPTATRNQLGEFVPDQSPLDQQISLSQSDNNAIFPAFAKALGAACGKQVDIDDLARLASPIQAKNEVARDVLVRMLRALDPSPSIVRPAGDVEVRRESIAWALGANPGIDASHPATYHLYFKRISIRRDADGYFEVNVRQ